jgi:hypothetical protein
MSPAVKRVRVGGLSHEESWSPLSHVKRPALLCASSGRRGFYRSSRVNWRMAASACDRGGSPRQPEAVPGIQGRSGDNDLPGERARRGRRKPGALGRRSSRRHHQGLRLLARAVQVAHRRGGSRASAGWKSRIIVDTRRTTACGAVGVSRVSSHFSNDPFDQCSISHKLCSTQR